MNILNRAIQSEFDDFVQNIYEALDTSITVSNAIGDIVVPIMNTSVYENVNILNENIKAEDIQQKKSFKIYIDKFAGNIDIVPFENISKQELLTMTSTIARELKPEYFAGILVMAKDSNYIINITHPVVAFLITLDLIEIPENGKMAIYRYKVDYNSKLTRRDGQYSSRTYEKYKKAYKQYWESVIVSLANTMIVKLDDPNKLAKQIKVYRPSKLMQYINRGLDFTAGVQEYTDSKEVFRDHALYYVPLQMLAGGVAYPYYGDIPFYDTSKPKAAIGAVTTGNLNFEYEDGVPLTAITERICTGSFNPKTFRGIQTLSKVNVGSLYHQYFVPMSVFINNEAAIEVSTDIIDEYLTMLEKEREAQAGIEETPEELFEEEA